MKIKKFTFLIFFLILSLLPALGSDLKWSQKINSFLPKAVAKIEIKKSHRSDIEKFLGKANLIEGDKNYYELDGFRYALEIVFKQDIVSEFSYTFIKNRPTFKELKLNLDLKKLSPYPKSVSSSRYFQHSDSEGDIVIDPISKDIYSVRLR